MYLVASRLTPQSNTTTCLTRLYIVSFTLAAVGVIIAIINTALNSVQSPEKISEEVLEKWFAHFDRDCNGFLDRDECRACLKTLGLVLHPSASNVCLNGGLLPHRQIDS